MFINLFPVLFCSVPFRSSSIAVKMSLENQFSRMSVLHPSLEEVNNIICWHEQCAESGRPIIINNMFLQSLFFKVHELYNSDKSALDEWVHGSVYKDIYERPNIDITKANAEFYYILLII